MLIDITESVFHKRMSMPFKSGKCSRTFDLSPIEGEPLYKRTVYLDNSVSFIEVKTFKSNAKEQFIFEFEVSYNDPRINIKGHLNKDFDSHKMFKIPQKNLSILETPRLLTDILEGRFGHIYNKNRKKKNVLTRTSFVNQQNIVFEPKEKSAIVSFIMNTFDPSMAHRFAIFLVLYYKEIANGMNPSQ